MALKGRLGALTEPQFRLLWIGRATTVIGDAVMPVTVVFAILSLGGSASQIGLVLGVSMAVRAVLLIFGGVVADMVPRRLVLVGTEAMAAVVQTAVGLVLLTGRGSMAVLLGASVFYGAASALSKPALTGIVPQTVSKERLQQANALMGISESTARIFGPALAGLIIAASSPGWAYLFDAVTFALSAVTLMLLRTPPVSRKVRPNVLRDIVVGWREMSSRSWYWTALCSHAVWNLGSGVFVVLGPVIVAKQAGGAASWGLVSAGMAAGSLIGGVALLRWRPRRPLVIGHLALLLTAPQIASLIGPSPVTIMIVATIAGAAGVTFINQLWTTAVQQLIPENVISRLSSYDWLVSFTVAPLGYAMVGPLSEQIGIPATLAVAIGLVTLPVLGILAVPGIRNVRQSSDGQIHLSDAGAPGAAEYEDETAAPGRPAELATGEPR